MRLITKKDDHDHQKLSTQSQQGKPVSFLINSTFLKKINFVQKK